MINPIKEWANEQFKDKIKNPLANKTEELENQAGKYWIMRTANSKLAIPLTITERKLLFTVG